MVFEAILFFTGLLITSWLFANLEIQIEGGAGWAAKLPTWRIENRWTRLFFGKRALTGYHLYAILFVTIVSHAPFFIGMIPITWHAEERILSFNILFWIVEDFLWFVCNPEYGLRRFRKQHIWWHEGNWWWIMPRDYWLFVPVGVYLFFISLRGS